MKFHILLVDDDIINRKLIKAMLTKHKDIVASIIETNNGKEALEKLHEHKEINLILLDIIMPILDGKSFLQIFRRKKEYSSIPVIVLTTDDSKKSEVLDYGADGVIIKPVKEEELLKHIKYWLQAN